MKEINTFVDPQYRFLTVDNNRVYFMLDGDSIRIIFTFIRCWKETNYPRHTFQHHHIIFVIVNIENNISDVYVTNDEDQREMATREFRDPIHRFIRVNPYELSIIDTEEFRRLRYIHQLGLTYYVYPGAEHKRFEHSLGTMELASKLFDILKEKNKKIFYKEKPESIGLFNDENEMKRYKQILRIVCLLHDIGHYPFSHGSEGIWDKNHEEMSKEIILSEPIKSKIEDNSLSGMDIKAEEVSYVVANEPEIPDGKLDFLKQILTGDLGVDRIDYLVRDSLHTGVLYGMFDYHRLLDTFLVHVGEEEDPELCLEKDGVQAAEGLILARYFMFSQVYFHKTRSAYDVLLVEYMKELSQEETIDFSDIDTFLGYNDYILLNQIKKDSMKKEDTKRIKLAKIIINREHHRRVSEVDANNLVIGQNPEGIYKKIEGKIIKELSDEVTGGIILFDRSMNRPTKFEQVDFNICDNDDLYHIFGASELIRTLNKIDLFRVYAAKGCGLDTKINDIVKETIKPYVRRG